MLHASLVNVRINKLRIPANSADSCKIPTLKKEAERQLEQIGLLSLFYIDVKAIYNTASV
jgi:hypothetical protein